MAGTRPARGIPLPDASNRVTCFPEEQPFSGAVRGGQATGRLHGLGLSRRITADE